VRSVSLYFDIEAFEVFDVSCENGFLDDVGCRTDDHVTVTDRIPFAHQFVGETPCFPHYGCIGGLYGLRGEDVLNLLALLTRLS